MKKVLIILLILSITIVAYATFPGAGVRYVRPMHPQVNTVGLIGHWKLWDGLMSTGLVFDYSLGGKGGTLFDTDAPAAPTLIPAYPGFDFDGVNDFIEIDDHDDFSLGDGITGTPFSIGACVYMRDATKFVIASKGILNVDAEWRFYVEDNDKLFFHIMDESFDDCYIGRGYNTVLTAYENQWICLVATYDGGTSSAGIRLYLNGVRVDDINSLSNGANFVSVENLAHAVRIGKYSIKYANGLIDNVMFFNKELSAIETRNIYEVTRWRYSR